MLLLSLLITVFVQAVIAVTRLRGSNLLWGVERLIGQLDPRLKEQAAGLANKVLRHPALTHLPKRPATALRPSELVLVLKDLADNDPSLTPETQQVLNGMFERAAGEGSTEMVAKAEELIGKLDKSFPGQTAVLRETVERTLGATQQIVVKVDAWFDTVMDRTSERFKMYSRLFTILCAFAFGFLLQIDALAVIRQLSNNSAMRDRVVAIAEPALKTAEDLQSQAQQQTDADAVARLKALQPILSNLNHQLDDTSLTLVPEDPLAFPGYGEPRHLIGMFMTAILLSLGAPFWYNALRRVSDLRPIVARNVEGEAPKAQR